MAEGKLFTVDPSKPVELAVTKDGPGSATPKTVGDVFKESVKKYSGLDALKYKEDGEWKSLSFKEYYDLSIRAAKSLLKVSLSCLLCN